MVKATGPEMDVPRESCLVCGSTMVSLFVKEYPYFGGAEYHRCEGCSFVHSDHIKRAGSATVATFYRDSSFERDDPGYFSRAKTALSGLRSFARKVGLRLEDLAILDYGCGEGTFLSLCRAGGMDAKGYDPYPTGSKVADFLIPPNRMEELGDSFDIVTCLEVVEHADTPDIFASLLGLLKPGGHIFFSTGIYCGRIHTADWEYFVPAHCSVYSVRSLEILAERLGARRVFLLRHPFVDIRYLLTGEVWRKEKAGGGSVPDAREVESIDMFFATAPPFLKGWFYRHFIRFVYRSRCFV